MTRETTEPSMVDQRLWMFDPNADRKCFRLHEHTSVMQHMECIPCTVTDRQHDMAGTDDFPAFQGDRPDLPSGVDADADDLLSETILAAKGFDFGAYPFNDRDQPEGADVRLGVPQDFFRTARRDKLGKHFPAEIARLLDAAVKLSIGERSGAAFAELCIALRQQHATPPQPPCVACAFTHDAPALEDDRTDPHFRQHQGSEQTARTAADYDRPRRDSFRCSSDRSIGHIRYRAKVWSLD